MNRRLFVEMPKTPDKSYSRDNRLVGSESPYRRPGSTPLRRHWGVVTVMLHCVSRESCLKDMLTKLANNGETLSLLREGNTVGSHCGFC